MMADVWYPTITGLCDGCGGEYRCVGCCPRGVFAVVYGEVRVVQPLSCVPGCASCAPACPRGAIQFPPGASCHQPAVVRRGSPFRRVRCEACGAEFLTDIPGKTRCFGCDALKSR